MQLTITGYSTALFSTWFFIDELGILLDAGDGVMSGLLQKSRKVKHAFISHADRDHLTGLFQFNQLNARDGLPIIRYPKDCGSFPALAEFTSRFDPHVGGVVWEPIVDQQIIELRKDLVVKAIRNNHVEAPLGTHKSLSYQIFERKRKLKPEFQKLSGNEIKKLREDKGDEFITEDILINVLNYSGDTPVDDCSRWDKSNVLIHEATFLTGYNDAKVETHGNKHSYLEDVMKMVSEIEVEKLILSHFSSRYEAEEIDKRILKLCKEFKIKIPVYRILPGLISRDILAQNPLNS